jgi:2-polyprenyl-3-methyl-5-hydroxy-6-metoxy-1,4-benzoquinol methylase
VHWGPVGPVGSVGSVALCSAWGVWCTGGLWVLWVLESLGVSWESGAENGSLLMDKVRTSTYASFILFHDAVVLDIGCGIGILSLRATKSGAKHVYAVGVSDIAEKAEQIVRANGLENAIM